MPDPAKRRSDTTRVRRTGRSERRLVWLCGAVLLAVAGIHYYWVGPGLSASARYAPSLSGARVERYQPLSGVEQRRLAEQRDLARELARRHVGSPLTGSSLEDLRVLQSLVDGGEIEREQTWELQALGVALGDVMASRLGLDWIAYQDEYGRNRALRLDDTDVVIFPVTMISKRIEAGLPVDVQELWEKTQRTLREARPGA